MKKRVLSLALSFALAFCSAAYLPGSIVTDQYTISASALETDSGLVYSTFYPVSSAPLGYEITGYKGTASELVIPEKINGRPVVSIQKGVFGSCENLKKVTLPASLVRYKEAFAYNKVIKTVVLSEGMHTIDTSAFESCSSLSSVTLPSTLESIDDYAFNGCSALASITIPKSVRYLGRQAFSFTALKKVSVPANVEIIQTYAFLECESLASVTLSKGLKEIDYGAFSECTALKSIVLPEGLTTIYGNAFDRCSALASVTIPKTLYKLEKCFYGTPWYDEYKQQELKKGTGFVMINNTLYDAPDFNGTSLVLPSNTKYIVGSGTMNGPFTNKQNLTSVTLNEGLEGIGDYAFLFTKISKLKLPSTLKEIGSYKICPDNTVVTVASGNKYFTVYDNGLYDMNKTILYHYPTSKVPTKALPDGLKEIALNGFRGNEKTTELTLPKTLNKIGTMAFYNCKALKKLTIPASVTNIRFDDAFGKDGNGIIEGFECYGYEDSTAQSHCSRYGIKFVSLGTCSHSKTKSDYDIDEDTCKANKDVTRCTTCGKAVKSVSKFAHKPVKTYHYNEATCTDAAFDVATCKACGDAVLTKTANKKDHDYYVKRTYVAADFSRVRLSYECKICKSGYAYEAGMNYQRFSGANRYETAVSISASMASVNTVVIASGLDFPDALAGVPLAKQKSAPILLAMKDSVPASTLKELKFLKPSNIIILGGEGVISGKVVNELKSTKELSSSKITRVCGNNRYGTAVETAKLVNPNPTEIFFVSGSGYPDALSAGTVAAIKNAPIIYLKTNGTIEANTASYLAELAKKKCVKNAYFIGGTGVISDDMMKQAASALGLKAGSTAQRVFGANRYATNIAVNTKFSGTFASNKMICVAKGLDFPDALAGGAYAAYWKTPLVLEDSNLSDEQKNYIHSIAARNFAVFGGTAAVPDELVKQTLIAAV